MTLLLPTTTSIANDFQAEGWGYHVKIDDGTTVTYFPLAAPSFQIEDAPLQAPRVQTEQAAEDFTEEFGKVYSRGILDGGEGLDFLHVPDRIGVQTRFWESQNVDVFHTAPGEPYGVRLSKATEEIGTNILTFAGSSCRVGTDNDVVLGMDVTGNDLVKVENINDASPTVSAEDPHDGEAAEAPNDLAALDGIAYVSLPTNGIHQRSAGDGGTWSHWSDETNITRIWAVKGRVLGYNASTGTLRQLEAAAASTTVYTPNRFVQAVADLGAVIAAADSSGKVSFFEDVSGTLTLSGEYQVSDQQVVTGITGAAGIVLFATLQKSGSANVRWPLGGNIGDVLSLYRADLFESSSGLWTFQNIQLLRQWENDDGTPNFAIHTFAVTADSVYFGLTPNKGGVEIWRYYLPTGGLAAQYWNSSAGNSDVRTIDFFDDLLYWTNQTEVRRVVLDDTFSPDGYFIGPLADFFTSDSKQWIEATLVTDDQFSGAANTQVQLRRSTDPDAITDINHASWTLDLDASVSAGESLDKNLTNVTGRYLAGYVRLIAGQDAVANDKSPVFRSFSYRAYPPADRDEILQLAVNVSDQMEAPNKVPVVADGWGDLLYQRLRTYRGQDITVTLLGPPAQMFHGLVETVSTPVQEMTERGSRTVVSTVTIRGKDVTP